MGLSARLNTFVEQAFHLKHEAYTKLAYLFSFLPPHRYVFILTNQCNLRCKDCFLEKFSNKHALSKNEWINFSNSIPQFSRITITGGEPLLVKEIKNIFKNIAVRHQCNLITNGILLTEDMIDFLLSFPKFKVLAVSIDGLKEETMRIRGFSEGQWEYLGRVMRYFVCQRNARRSRCILEVKTLVLNENINRLFELHKYCMEDLGVDHHTFQLLKGSPLQHSDKVYPLESIFKESHAPIYESIDILINQLEKIRQYNVANNKVAFFHPKIGNLNSNKALRDISFINSEVFNNNIFQPCRFPWSSLHVNYDGEVFPCISVSIGNIREKNIKEILRSRHYKKFLSVIRQQGTVQACNRCGWLRLRKI